AGVGHLSQAGALAAQDIFHLAVAVGLAAAEKVNVLSRFRLRFRLLNLVFHYCAAHVSLPLCHLYKCCSAVTLQITNFKLQISYFFSVTISEKSAIVENSFNKLCNSANRFARTFSSSTITITLSKNVSTAGRIVAISASAAE